MAKKECKHLCSWNFIQHIPFHSINTVAFHKVPILHVDTRRNVVQKLNRVCFVRNPSVTKVQPPLFRTKTELLTQTKSKCGINPKTQCTNQCNAELFFKTLAKLKRVCFEKHHLHPVSGKYGDNKWKKHAILSYS